MKLTVGQQYKRDAALYQIESVHHLHGHECLCGFASAVSRMRTKHLLDLAAAAMTELVESWLTPPSGPYRVGTHYGIHVYEDDRPVATFAAAEEAQLFVAVMNRSIGTESGA